MFNAYEILNLKQRFEIDLSEIENSYLKTMQSFHPDHLQFRKTDQTFSNQVTEQAALINQAYSILKDPVMRAQHILELHNVSCSFESSVSSEILTQSLQDREELEEADSPQTIENLKKNIQACFDQSLIKFHYDYTQQAWTSCKQHLEKLIYYKKFLHEAQKKLWTLEEDHQ